MTNNSIRDIIKNTKTKETQEILDSLVKDLENEGFIVEFGGIGVRTTYALVYTADHEEEYVGYTYVRDMKYYNENTGKLKALQQAIARRESTQII